MADPLTALIHAVQVMNFLKTLILKTIRQREEEEEPCGNAAVSTSALCSTRQKAQTSWDNSESVCIDSSVVQGKLGNKQETQSSSSKQSDSRTEFEVEETGDGRNNGDWLSWRKGVRKLCQHSVFQLSKQVSLKKTRSLGVLSGN